MTDSNTPSASTAPAKPRGSLPGLALLLLLVLGVLYVGWQQLTQRDQEIAALGQQLTQAEQAYDKQLHDLQQTEQEHLTQLAARVDTLANSNNDNWRLAEAEYLLRLSNHYALLVQDGKMADKLLMNADEVLQKLESTASNPSALTDIRQKIAAEHSALASHAGPDSEGLFFQLDALVKQLDQLPVIDVSSLSKQVAAASDERPPPDQPLAQRLMASLLRALRKVGGYVRIQQHDQQTNPLLTPDEQQRLKQQLRFRIEQAQLALLQHHQAIYSSLLNDVRNGIQQYYVLNPDIKNSLLASLDACRKIPVEQPLPDLSVSLHALMDYQQTLLAPTRGH